MHQLTDQPFDARALPPSVDGPLPAAVAATMLCLVFFSLLFVI